MVGWISIITDKVFVGFGPSFECSHCHNRRWQEVWQTYTQQFMYSIIPTPKSYGEFLIFCPICHWGLKIRKKERSRVAEILEAGKDPTKQSFQKMPEKEKQLLLKHLNRNGFAHISRLLAFDDPALV